LSIYEILNFLPTSYQLLNLILLQSLVRKQSVNPLLDLKWWL